MKHLLTLSLCFLALSLSVYGQVPDYIPSDGLVAWYPFNGNANDASDNNLNGSVTGATLTTDRFGTTNSCYNFDYTNWSWGTGGDEIYIPYNQIFNSSNITVSVWARRLSAGYSNQHQAIIKRFQFGYSNPNGQTWVIQTGQSPDYLITSGVIQAAPDNNQESIFNTGPNLTVNDWFHIVLTFDGIKANTYINGLLFESQPANGLALNTVGNSGISIGVSDQANGNWSPFDGDIDDIGIWNRALSEEEILSLYNALPPNPGCTDVTACNFNPEATLDDDTCYSCDLPASHCGDGTVWDSETQECVVANLTDTNLDGCTDLNDLMDILAAYGDCAVAEFTCGDDIGHDGYDYSTVQIGDQCWFAENCCYLPEVSDLSINSTNEPHYSVYGYEGTDVTAAQATTNYATYGVLYNWPAVMTAGICPSGWHIPSDGEFTELTDFLGGEGVAGGKMKSTYGWNNEGNGTNSSGFNALPGGIRASGGFSYFGFIGYWWSASESGSYSWHRILNSYGDIVSRLDHLRSHGFSARCVRD
jgi:uncharacterized protein (TIGR02145 family)